MSEIVNLADRRVLQRGGGNKQGRRASFGSVRKLPSGRFQARYTAPDGIEHRAPTTFQFKGDAQTWLAMERTKITNGKWMPVLDKPTTTTFTDYSTDWLARRELKPRTRTEYGRLLTVLQDRFGRSQMPTITSEAVRKWYAGLDQAHPTRRAHLYALLRTILGAAVDEDMIPANPARMRGAGRSKRVRKIRPANLSELEAITDAMPERWRLLVLLAAWCALRFGELTELRRKDVDLARGILHVRRGVTWVNGDPVIGLPKSDAGVRDVSIPPHLLPAVERHLAEHAQPGREGLLFYAVSGSKHLNHGTISKAFRPARESVGRDDLRLHDLRHTGAVMAAQAGATTRELMDRLGHSTAEMSMRYQHVADGRQDEIAKRLSAMAEGEAK